MHHRNLQNMSNQSFGKHEKIRRKKDYANIYRQGKRSYSEHFTVITNFNQTGVNRLGIAVSKKVGNSVKRNRIKRLLREFFRLNKARLSASRDFVIIAKRSLPPLSYQDVNRELKAILISETDV